VAKAPSKARASSIRSLRMSAKLVASTNEYGRSSWTRSQLQASISSASSMCSTLISGRALIENRAAILRSIG
jgi:hypothetical protein